MMKNRPWLKSYGSIPSEIDADRYESVVHMLESAMANYAGKNAFCSFGKSITYAQVDALSAQFCSYLQNELGVKKGDRVAVMMPNLAAFPIAFLGIMRAGAIQVNVNLLIGFEN
jgi:long-chain acyl-CoA synthetase